MHPVGILLTGHGSKNKTIPHVRHKIQSVSTISSFPPMTFVLFLFFLVPARNMNVGSCKYKEYAGGMQREKERIIQHQWNNNRRTVPSRRRYGDDVGFSP